jgi:hypothetical protein
MTVLRNVLLPFSSHRTRWYTVTRPHYLRDRP